MMVPRKQAILSVLTMASLSATSGCLERKEKITVSTDGRITIQLTYKGDTDEFEHGDAMPSNKEGWLIDRETEMDDEGKEQVTLTAVQVFAPAEDIPRSFALSDDPNADLYLDFPTTLQIKRSRDGTYYHFYREYIPRRWAYIQSWQTKFMDQSVEKIAEKPIDQLTQNDRVQLVRAFIRFEAHKHIEFSRAALDECEPDLLSIHWLKARRALLDAYEEDHLLEVPGPHPLDLNPIQKTGTYTHPSITSSTGVSRWTKSSRKNVLNKKPRELWKTDIPP